MGVSRPLCCFSGCNTLLLGWMRAERDFLITDRPGVDFLVQEIPRKRSREFLSSIPKQALEASRRQLGVTHRILGSTYGRDRPGWSWRRRARACKIEVKAFSREFLTRYP